MTVARRFALAVLAYVMAFSNAYADTNHQYTPPFLYYISNSMTPSAPFVQQADGTWVPASASLPSPVACVSGCVAGTGTTSNASSLATSSTNGQGVSFMYGFTGTQWNQLLVDASSFLKVNCAVGCSAGTFNNNIDGVATSSSNGQVAAWMYGWNGSFFDRLQVDGSKNLKVTLNASNANQAVTEVGTWNDNITQFGSSNVQTGAGAGGAGIPRMTVSNDSSFLLWDGTNTASVKGASTAAVATDKALVVAISPNNTVAATQSGSWSTTVVQPTAANLNATVVNAGTFAVQAGQTGTWTVQPGNTANTTPWLVAGNISNAGSAVITGSTNVGVNGYSYGFNGTTWDQLQVDASKYLKIDCITGCAGGASDVVASGGLASNNAAATSSTLNNVSTTSIYTTGAWVGTLNFEGTVDNTTWFALNAVPVGGGALVTTATTNGQWDANVAGLQGFRVRMSPYTSGTATVTARISTGSGSVFLTNALPTGSNTIGAVTQSAGPWTSNITQIGGSALAFGQAVMASSLPVAFASNQSAIPASQSGTWNIQGTFSNAGSAVNTTSTNVPVVGYSYGFNGTTWDQLQVDASKNLKTIINAALPTGGNTIGAVNQAGAPWTVLGTISNAGSAITATSTNVPTNAYGYGYNGSSWDQLQVDGSKFLKINCATGCSAGSVSDIVASGTLSSAASITSATLNSVSTLTVQTTGVWSGTLAFEGTVDGSNWFALNAVPVGGGTTVTTSTANGNWNVSVGGLQNMRTRMAAYTSGTATITARNSVGGGAVYMVNALPTGANVIGAVTESGTWNVTVNTALPTGGNTIGAVTQASGPWTQNLTQIAGTAVSTGNGTSNAGDVRVNIASDNTAFSVNAIESGAWNVGQTGTWTVQPGNTANTTPWLVQLSDGTNSATVKAASTAAVATDKAQVVAISPNNTVAVTESGTWNVGQTGTWTVQPGNTANTTPWLVAGNVSNASSAVTTTATNVPVVGYNFGYNGSSWDQLQVDASKFLKVNCATGCSAGSVSDIVASGALAANNAAATSATLNSVSSVKIYVTTGGWVGTLNFEGTVDNTTWFALNAVPVGGGAIVTTSTVGGQWDSNVAGLQAMRVRMSPYTSGTATVTARNSVGAGAVFMVNALPTGTNTIGAVTQASGPWTSNITQFGGVAVNTGTGGSGTGTPRVTVANDSNILATESGTWNIQGTFSDASSAITPTSTNVPTVAYNYAYNGTTWDQMQVDASKNLKVMVNAALPTGANVIGGVTESGTWTVQPGNTANTTPWLVQLSDGTNNATVKAASTAAVATDKAQVVAISPNNTVAATESGAWTVTQSGTWTIQPGNTANTTPWLVAGNIGNTGDAVTSTSTNAPTVAYNYGYNGTTWDRLQVDGSKNLKVIVNAALPTGANTIGAVTQASGPWTVNTTQWGSTAVVTGGVNGSVGVGGLAASGAAASGNPVQGGGVFSTSAIAALTNGQAGAHQVDAGGNLKAVGGVVINNSVATWVAATGLNTTQVLMQNHGTPAIQVQLVETGTTTTAGAVSFEGTYDGTNWVVLNASQVLTPVTLAPFAIPYTLVNNTTQSFLLLVNGFQQVRAKLTVAITGTGAPQVVISTVFLPYAPTVAANMTQVGGTAISTGTGAGGAGIPRFTVSNDSQVKLWDGSNTAAVKAASTTAAAADPALVVGLSPNSNGCAGQALSSTNFTAISMTTGTRIITGTAAKATYICHIEIVTATAQNIALVEGTGTVCATGIAGMAGGSTAATGWNFAANGGIVKGDGWHTVNKSATNADDVCLLTSSTGQISGTVTWIQF